MATQSETNKQYGMDQDALDALFGLYTGPGFSPGPPSRVDDPIDQLYRNLRALVALLEKMLTRDELVWSSNGTLVTSLGIAEAAIADLVTADTALDGRLDTAETTLTDHETRIDDLETP